MLNAIITRKAGAFALAGALLFSAVSPVMQREAAAAVPVLDQIRVALFMNHSKSSVRSAVTLTTSGGYDIGLRTGKSVGVLFSGNEPVVRASADGYGVLLLETTDAAKAKALHDKLAASSDRAQLFVQTKQGKKTYRVVYGRFGAASGATQARTTLLADASVNALLDGFDPRLTGPRRIATPAVAARSAAEGQLATLQQAGLDAVLGAYDDGTGKPAYAVFVGDEPDASSLQKLQSELARLAPSVSAQAVGTDKPYVLLRTDGSASAGGGAQHFQIAGDAGGKLLVHSKQPGIAVKEREDRKYRGNIEIGVYQGELAVINELPYDEYLYSVVGAEMGSSYPLEALKAQAVIARTYALTNDNGYDIANVVDNTYDQAYYGMSYEADIVIQAVNATHGEVVLNENNELAATFYSASAGGRTADASEVWSSGFSHLKSVISPDEGMSEKWYRVLLANGQIGYVNGNYVQETGQKNAIGYVYLVVNEDNLNVRSAPTTFSSLGTVITKLNVGDRVLALETIDSKTPYVWARTYDAAELSSMLSKSGTAVTGPVTQLVVTKRGPSGRASEVQANGTIVTAKTADALRSVFGSLPSTLFDIVEIGRYTMKGAGQAVQKSGSQTVSVLSANGSKPATIGGSTFYVLGGDAGSVRPVTPENTYLFEGRGFGHGIGLSQYGARNYALQGFTYDQIIKAYFSGVKISKE